MKLDYSHSLRLRALIRKYEYERETGKKLSIKTIATQLIDEGFDIKGGNSSKALNGYVCNDPETIYE